VQIADCSLKSEGKPGSSIAINVTALCSLFCAADQLDARLCGLHQAAIRGEIIKRHAARGETCLELLSDRGAIQLGKPADRGGGADPVFDNKSRQGFVDDLGS